MSDCCCGNTIDTSALEAGQRRVLKYVLLINLVTFVMMIGSAFYGGSAALFSGALDNLGDALTYMMSLAVVGASMLAKARVAFFKGLLILLAAFAVAGQIIWRIMHPETPLFAVMGIAALLNLGANVVCLTLLSPHRNADVNMASVYECSRNDVYDGGAVILAAVLVWGFSSPWPDILIALGLLVLFLRSSIRVLRNAWLEMRAAPA